MSILKHKYTPIVTIISVVVLLVASILVPVSTNEWTGYPQSVPYTTQYVSDSSAIVGQTAIKQVGEDGEKTVTYQTRRNIWQVISDKLFNTSTDGVEVSSTDTPPTKQIISYGTKPATSSTTSGSMTPNAPSVSEDCSTVVTPHPTIYEDTSSMPTGTTSIKTTGVDGMYVTCKSGGSYSIAQPVTEVIYRGTGSNQQYSQDQYNQAYATCRGKYNGTYAQTYQQLISQGVQVPQATGAAAVAGNKVYDSCMASYGY